LTSVARAALEAGAASVLACLWPIRDAVARIFMGAFYAALARERVNGDVDLRLVVDEARSAVGAQADASMLANGRRRDGRPVPATHTPASTTSPDGVELWAPFVLFGRPTLPPSPSLAAQERQAQAQYDGHVVGDAGLANRTARALSSVNVGCLATQFGGQLSDGKSEVVTVAGRPPAKAQVAGFDAAKKTLG
jgi:hypothetical protein